MKNTTVVKFTLLLSMLTPASQLLAQQSNANVNTIRVTGYAGIMHPIVTFGNDGAKFNFNGAYTGGLVTGINLWKSQRVGFSFETVGIITTGNGTSKMSKLLLHPGLLIGLGNGFTLANRAALETSGRYGVTAVLNKVIVKKKDHSYFIALPIPARFGNNLPSTVGVGFQFGLSF
ncbi:hypothetical protein SAMN05660909_03883 [Chitinophaga terrae (ex Kim and Jung 2007)]|uniref:Outer membrane beta-barrel protein n=1 Tax=Chitinophaga terrae (ex Kim and Jung 2007) TaxID=408074 RepID=A0A1H4EPK3_9BACT|nr:hypothetical protein [Chitinophaga terrae (ex Kim and Jung 2007)]SEA86941.1 hypothetical protein SAMN05660909_03883 [Chitinophaga terrae (ex Kim and Jung 2007)]